MVNKYDIQIYPPTSVITGKEAVEEYIESCADCLYDEWVCDRRFDPNDVKKLLDIAIERRNKY